MLQSKHIILGVTGSIAAYKAVLLARLLHDAGAHVWPVMTANAGRFVGALTFTAVAGRPTVTDLWGASDHGQVGHVEIAQQADALVVAPCSANTLARLSHGEAVDALSTIALSCRAPKFLAPAMESAMWENAATQANVARLRDYGWSIVAPTSGFLASGRSGVGRMAEPDDIVAAVSAGVSPHDMQGEHVLVTAGPTREPFDPARFISNPSTGKMGYALAKIAHQRGARVHLISGPSALPPPVGVTTTHITTTQDLLTACQSALPETTLVVMAAAPADWRPLHVSKEKIKKAAAQQQHTLVLENTPDVLATLQARTPQRVVIGFAAETQDLVAHGRTKLASKNLDMLVANNIAAPDQGFGADTNAAIMLLRDGSEVTLPLMHKEAMAGRILDQAVRILASRRQSPTGQF